MDVKSCYVWLESGDHDVYNTKVGVSDDPEKRLAEKNAEGPVAFELLHVFPGGGTRLEKRIDNALEEWHTHGEYHKVAARDLQRFKDIIVKTKDEFDAYVAALDALNAALDAHGEPASAETKATADGKVVKLYRELRDVRKRKRVIENEEEYLKTELKKHMTIYGAGTIKVEQPGVGDLGKVTWKESVRQMFDSKAAKELLTDEQIEACTRETVTRTFNVY